MFMSAIEKRSRRQRERTADFEEVFIRIGRVACEEKFKARRTTINRWLEECGKDRLLNARYEFVANQGRGSPRGPAKRITRQDMAQILTRAFPVRDHRRVNPNLARHAAQFLRINRNGGFIVSPCSDGDWRIGTRKVSAAQLVDFAKTKGFEQGSRRQSDAKPKATFNDRAKDFREYPSRKKYVAEYCEKLRHESGNVEDYIDLDPNEGFR